MGFLKRHLFFIICGVAAAGGIALAVTGIGAMPEVLDEMKKAEGLYNELTNLQNKSVSADMIRAERKRIDRVLDDCEEVRKAASDLFSYRLLVEEVLPEGNSDARIEFLEKYQDAMQELMTSLNSGTTPTETEIELVREKIATEQYRAQQRGLDEGAAPVRSSQPTEVANTIAGVLTPAGAKENAAARASIVKALQIRCYALDPAAATKKRKPSSLQYSGAMAAADSMEPPFPDDIWWAQLGYWVQKDVVGAIVSINEAAAAAAKERGEDAWVGNMPVKDIISVRLSDGFVVDDDDYFVGAAAGGYNEAFPAGTKNTVFTQSVSGASYDVLQFTLKLIMDQRDIPLLINELTRDKFHTPLRVAYKSVPPNRKMVGKIYGSEPTVNVVLEFETVLIPAVFRQWIPQEVCELYDYMACPEPNGEEEEED